MVRRCVLTAAATLAVAIPAGASAAGWGPLVAITPPGVESSGGRLAWTGSGIGAAYLDLSGQIYAGPLAPAGVADRGLASQWVGQWRGSYGFDFGQDDRGDVAVAWSVNGRELGFATASAGTGFGAPQRPFVQTPEPPFPFRIAPPQPSTLWLSRPSVAVTRNGRVLIAWSQTPEYPPPIGRGQVTIAAGATNGSPLELSAPAALHAAFDPLVGSDDAGNALIVWHASGPRPGLMSATRYPSGDLSPAKRIADGSPRSVQLVVTPAGQAALVWQRDGRAEMARGSTSRGLGRPEVLRGAGVSGVSVALDSRGNALAVWRRRPGGSAIEVAFARAGSRPGPVRKISARSDASLPAGSPSAAFASTGTAIAVWTRFGDRVARVEAAVGSMRRGFSRPTRISPLIPPYDPAAGRLNYYGEPRITVGNDGRAIAWWRRGSVDTGIRVQLPLGVFSGRVWNP